MYKLNTKTSIIEEPGAIVSLAGICAGGVQVTGVSTVTGTLNIKIYKENE